MKKCSKFCALLLALSLLLPLCLTFAESPKAVMSDKPFFYLMTKEDKLRSLESIGIRRTVMLDFNAVMDMSAESFFLFRTGNTSFIGGFTQMSSQAAKRQPD